MLNSLQVLCVNVLRGDILIIQRVRKFLFQYVPSKIVLNCIINGIDKVMLASIAVERKTVLRHNMGTFYFTTVKKVTLIRTFTNHVLH